MGLSASSCFRAKFRFFGRIRKKDPHKKVQLSHQRTKPIKGKNIHPLLEHVEQHGLHVEGIYRKSGCPMKMRQLRKQLEKDPMAVRLEDYPVHCVAGLVSEWLRNLPEPPMTFSRYSAFLHAMDLPDKSQQLGRIYQVLDTLPPANTDMLERLLYHLVRVASEEGNNRMSIHALAILFAPSMFSLPDTLSLPDIMKDMSKITMCLELILNEEMRRYEELKEGEQLECEEALSSWTFLKPCSLYRTEGQYNLHTI